MENGDGRDKFFASDNIKQILNVDINTLDSLLSSEDFDDRKLVKIDVQGYEDRVLKGACKLLSKVTWAVIEISFYEMYQKGVDAQSVLDIMKSNGFVFMGVLDFHVSSSVKEIESIIEMDALFVNSNIDS